MSVEGQLAAFCAHDDAEVAAIMARSGLARVPEALDRLVAADDALLERTRRLLDLPPVAPLLCAHCGGPFTRARTGRPRRFCSHRCRKRAWLARHGA